MTRDGIVAHVWRAGGLNIDATFEVVQNSVVSDVTTALGVVNHAVGVAGNRVLSYSGSTRGAVDSRLSASYCKSIYGLGSPGYAAYSVVARASTSRINDGCMNRDVSDITHAGISTLERDPVSQSNPLEISTSCHPHLFIVRVCVVQPLLDCVVGCIPRIAIEGWPRRIPLDVDDRKCP